MVREVKFSCDASEGIEMPPVRDRFDDADDPLLDAVVPDEVSRRRMRRPDSSGRRGRHLAGADWIDSVPLPRRPDGAPQA